LVDVHWPSGVVDKVAGVGVNRILSIKEGQGDVGQKSFKGVTPNLRNPQ
jgi:hypothetical protein